MKDLFHQLLLKLVTYFLFLLILFIISFSFLTNEFPPRISLIKTQLTALSELKQNYSLLMKNAADKIKNNTESNTDAQDQAENSNIKSTELAQLEAFQAAISEIKLEQVRLNNKLDMIIEQNQKTLMTLQMMSPR